MAIYETPHWLHSASALMQPKAPHWMRLDEAEKYGSIQPAILPKPCWAIVEKGWISMHTPSLKQMPLPPIRKGYYVRNAIARVRDTLGLYLSLHREYGGIVRYNLAHIKFCIIFDPDLTEELLFRHHSALEKGYLYTRIVSFSKPTVATAMGDHHRRLRRIIQPWFHKKALEQYAVIMAECATARRDKWRHGQIVDFHKELRELTLSIGLETFFNNEIEIDQDIIEDALKLVVKDFTLTVLPSRALHRFILSRFFRRFQRAWDEMGEHIRMAVRSARSDSGDRIDLVAFLACSTDEDGELAFSEDEVVEEIIEMVFAAHETTASTLTWAMYYLSQNRTVFDRMAQEIDEVMKGRPSPITMADYSQLTYTRAVVEEALRLGASTYYIGRTSTKDFTLGGYFIPAGANLQCCSYVSHRDERYFPNPEQFMPERWLGDQPERPRCAFMPLGAGSRRCPAEMMARMIMTFTIASIVQRWRLECVLDGPPKLDTFAGYLIKDSLPLRMIDRQREAQSPA